MIKIFDPRDKISRYWRLRAGSYIIGRNPDCDLFIDDETISRQHARVDINGDQEAAITDIGSRNGTVVNGKLISETTILNHNDMIELGKVGLKFKIIDKTNNKRESISLSDDDDLSDVSRLPMEKIIEQSHSNILENPRIFNSLFEFGKMLVVPGDNDEILSDSLSRLNEVIPFERAAVFSLEEDGKEISLAAFHHTMKAYSNSFSLSRTILHELLEKREAVLISDARIDERYAEQHSIISVGIRSAMAVPLYDEGSVFGVLYSDTSSPEKRYGENHLRLMATFGNMLAAKISNNFLLNERREKEMLEAELAVASQIQKQLLPGSIPDIENYDIYAYQKQCKEVGGDLYDISRLDDGNILIMLADVSGKGMGAALLASNILAAFRALYKSNKFDMLEATHAVSEQLTDFSRPGDFVTLFLALLDPIKDDMRYINAGHNPALMARAEGKIEYLEASGMPIGIMKSDSLKDEKIKFNSGDTIFIYTDGIPEAINNREEQFGDEKLKNLLLANRDKSSEYLANSILKEIDKFTADYPKSDDVTLIALRRNEK